MNKFNLIFKDLEEKIRQGIYQEGDLLPSENELTKTYDVSRETVRKALNLLLEHGYIQKQQGKGSIVLPTGQYQFPVSGLTSYKELERSQGIKGNTKVIVNDYLSFPDVLREESDMPEVAEVQYILRERLVNGEVLILDKDYFDPAIVPHIPTEVAEDSIYAYLEGVHHLDISYAKKTITVEPATTEDKELMQLQEPFVVVVRSDVYLDDTRLFQHTESRHRLDRFKFVEFARRRNV
ncbi:trehalose operon repressor [Vagococcus lutrae]|uniref:Trehalose operon repressor n=2 Tax=Vagococcus lutrae TaxID=81947 RepID=V6Q424_9ENTE|nr:trehalose operon repressor [Vagococcus lutrae]EST89492.1 trehalose operon repressor [Vagococcus lutrae LBD1]MCO7151361.1 trehalose operon repressor [Vagococcus lutrae]MDT2801760.1 trehalose operon repressor [Vagococcus lutrae]MDT2806889.1 trehalose operon repressor [Vagococcus lutrae]MDT2807730.1 trehalose operon repressor [Vagococcus lutrae]